MTFNELPISENIKEAIAEMGFETPSPIQAQSIPLILKGKDIIGLAQTGTGKTAAFGIPLVDLVDPNKKYTQAIVLCPTRELALQVMTECKKLAKHKKGLHFLAVYGGESIEKQINALKRGVHIVIGTPGRVIDHLERRTLKLDQVNMVILDEADEMLNMGFREDIELILEKVPEERQTILFSATMSKTIMDMTKKYQSHPELVKVTKTELTVSTIEQYYFEVPNHAKIEAMCRLIEMHQLKLMLVFCNTKRKVDEVVEQLSFKGYSVEGLHGDMRQMQRNSVMAKFRGGTVNILVATDVAARGIDVDNIEAVFNLDVPQDDEYYVHRIGRTGRAGKSGKAFTFVSGRNEFLRLKDLQHYTKVKIEKGTLPSSKDAFAFKLAKFKDHLKNLLTNSPTTNNLFEETIEELKKEGFSPESIAVQLLQIHIGIPGKEDSLANKNNSNDRGDRGDKRERDRKDRNRDRDRGERDSSTKMVRLFINIGKNHRISPGDILGAIAGESGISGKNIGRIELQEQFSYVEIASDCVDEVLEAMNDNTIKGKKVKIEKAKPRDRDRD